MVIISLKCLIRRETFVNLENGTKDGEFNYFGSFTLVCQLEKQDGVLMVCDSTNHRTQVFN